MEQSKGTFTPMQRGSARWYRCVFHASWVFTLAHSFSICGGPISRHWVIDLSILTNQRSLFLRIALWAISVGTCSGPAVEAQQTRGGVNRITQFLQTDPLRCPCAGSARALRAFSHVGGCTHYWWCSSQRRTITFETVVKLEAGCCWLK